MVSKHLFNGFGVLFAPSPAGSKEPRGAPAPSPEVGGPGFGIAVDRASKLYTPHPTRAGWGVPSGVGDTRIVCPWSGTAGTLKPLSVSRRLGSACMNCSCTQSVYRRLTALCTLSSLASFTSQGVEAS